MTEPASVYDRLREEVQTILIGNETIIEGLTISLLTRGHALLEGVPGVAKTTLALSFAAAVGLDANRVQMTPDVLPADVTGTHVYREPTGEFELRRGPVFANVVVVDEINRATPKTQSALLEAMQEETVTIDGESLELPTPFFVVATQNPIEVEGTYELPVAQRDRFQFKFVVDVLEDEEMLLLDRFDDSPRLTPDNVSQVVSPDELSAARRAVEDVYVDRAVKRYLLDLVAATRESPDTEYGASPRTTLSLLRATKARAAIRGREYVIPDDAKALAKPALVHRIVPSAEADLGGLTAEDVVDDVLRTVELPDESADLAEPAGDAGGDRDVGES